MSNQASTPLSGSAGPSLDGRLDSWKEIAAYLRREVRTVQRWEKSSGLPVHRLQIGKQGPVYAYKAELDAWYRDRRPDLDSDSAEQDAPSLPDVRTIRPWAVAGAVVLIAMLLWGRILLGTTRSSESIPSLPKSSSRCCPLRTSAATPPKTISALA